MNILNIKYLVAPTTLYRTFPPANLPNFPQPFYEEEVLLFENPFVSPRVFIAHIPIFEPDEKRAAERMKEMRDMLDKLIIINAPPPQGIKEQLKNVPLEDSSSALITSYSPNSVSIKASMLSPGFLVLSDTYHPDWKAFVNGRESRIFLTDLLIRSIFLPAGNHDVLFRFTPLAFYWGICVTLLFTILVLFLLNIRPK